MSPTPVSMSDPTAPASYSWEATSEQVAARYGVPVEEVVRFDLNTSPTPPELAARILAAGRFETSLSEYPPSDYRRLSEAAAARYGIAVEVFEPVSQRKGTVTSSAIVKLPERP